MVVCTRCGRQADEGEAFCGGCGAFLEWTAVPATSAENPPPVTPAAPHPLTAAAQAVGPPVIVSVSSYRVRVDPGGEASLEVQVSNRGRTVDHLSLEVLGPASAWSSVDPSTLNLMPDTTGSAKVRFRPSRTSAVRPGENPLKIAVISREHPGDSVVETIVVEVAPFLELEINLSPSVLHGHAAMATTLRASNSGNSSVELSLAGEDPEMAFEFEIDPTLLRVPPGTQTAASVMVKPRAVLQSGPDRTRPFRLLATAGDGSRRALDGTFVQTAMPRAPLLVTLGASAVQVEPGGEASVRVELANQGPTPDQLAIRLRGPAAAWAGVEPAPQLSLLSGASTTAVLHFRPPRAPTTQPGASIVEVGVWSREHPDASVVQRVTVEVLPYTGLASNLAPSVLRGRRDARARLALANHGNTPVELALSGDDPEMVFEFRISPPRLRLDPGGSAEASVEVKTRREHRSTADVTRPLRVLITAGDGSRQSVEASFVQEASRPRRRWPRLVVLLGVAGVIAVVAANLYGRGSILPPWDGVAPAESPPPESVAPPESPPPESVAPPESPPPESVAPPESPPEGVPNEPPQIYGIVEPPTDMELGYSGSEGSLWYTDVHFVVEAVDPEDGPVPDDAITWTTDRTDLQSEWLGTGRDIWARLYSDSCEGGATHNVTVTVTDSGGATVWAIRQVTIRSVC